MLWKFRIAKIVPISVAILNSSVYISQTASQIKPKLDGRLELKLDGKLELKLDGRHWGDMEIQNC